MGEECFGLQHAAGRHADGNAEPRRIGDGACDAAPAHCIASSREGECVAARERPGAFLPFERAGLEAPHLRGKAAELATTHLKERNLREAALAREQTLERPVRAVAERADDPDSGYGNPGCRHPADRVAAMCAANVETDAKIAFASSSSGM